MAVSKSSKVKELAAVIDCKKSPRQRSYARDRARHDSAYSDINDDDLELNELADAMGGSPWGDDWPSGMPGV